MYGLCLHNNNLGIPIQITNLLQHFLSETWLALTAFDYRFTKGYTTKSKDKN